MLFLEVMMKNNLYFPMLVVRLTLLMLNPRSLMTTVKIDIIYHGYFYFFKLSKFTFFSTVAQNQDNAPFWGWQKFRTGKLGGGMICKGARGNNNWKTTVGQNETSQTYLVCVSF